jgi:hypothetical protein
MSSAQGRFTSPDPYMPSADVKDPQSWNRYVYTRNNPLRFVDPNGLDWKDLSEEQRRVFQTYADNYNKTNKSTLSSKDVYNTLNGSQMATLRMRAMLLRIKQELRTRRHRSVKEVGQWLRQVVEGYYRYHGVPGNMGPLSRFRYRVLRLWRQSLRRRGGKRQPTWERLALLFARWLPTPRVHHPYPSERFRVKHPRWEPYAGKPLVRICPGGAS